MRDELTFRGTESSGDRVSFADPIQNKILKDGIERRTGGVAPPAPAPAHLAIEVISLELKQAEGAAEWDMDSLMRSADAEH